MNNDIFGSNYEKYILNNLSQVTGGEIKEGSILNTLAKGIVTNNIESIKFLNEIIDESNIEKCGEESLIGIGAKHGLPMVSYPEVYIDNSSLLVLLYPLDESFDSSMDGQIIINKGEVISIGDVQIEVTDDVVSYQTDYIPISCNIKALKNTNILKNITYNISTGKYSRYYSILFTSDILFYSEKETTEEYRARLLRVLEVKNKYKTVETISDIISSVKNVLKCQAEIINGNIFAYIRLSNSYEVNNLPILMAYEKVIKDLLFSLNINKEITIYEMLDSFVEVNISTSASDTDLLASSFSSILKSHKKVTLSSIQDSLFLASKSMSSTSTLISSSVKDLNGVVYNIEDIPIDLYIDISKTVVNVI